MEGPTLRVSLIEVSVKRESTVHRSESVFDKSCDEEMPEMRCDEYIPFRRNKQKNLRGKGGQKVNNNSTRDSAQTHGFPRELTTLRVAQFVLKIAHLAISMKPRGPRACGLLPPLWLLVPSNNEMSLLQIQWNLDLMKG